MLIDTLYASDSTPLAKCFELSPTGSLNKDPYPHVRRFTSNRVNVPTMASLYTALKDTARIGGCVLKGLLEHPITNEPRAGLTSSTASTDWILLDLDKVQGFNSTTEFLDLIFPRQSFDHIVQQSASSFVTQSPNTLNCHIFIALKDPVTPQFLKDWLKHINLTRLNHLLSLSPTGLTMRWPLDITTCQNDKLIYVAPPILTNINPLITDDGIVFVPGAQPFVTISHSTAPAVIEQLEQTKLNELRTAAGFPNKTYKIKQLRDIEYVANPPAMTVTGFKVVEHRGYAYFNINGGDSWGYYTPLENPEFVFNFKGEPNFLLKDLSKSHYIELKGTPDEAIARELGRQTAMASPTRFVVINHETDTITLVTYNPVGELGIPSVETMPTKELHALHWINEHKLAMPDYYPRWTITNDPTRPSIVVDTNQQLINLYRPTPLRINAAMLAGSPRAYTCPDVVHRLISHVVGDDEDFYDHFINWLACVWQLGRKNLTGWVFSGTQGTGKGVLFGRVLAPLFGYSYVHNVQASVLEKEFNHFVEGKQLVMIDEVDLHDDRSASRIMSALKELITERRISVRKMRTDHYMADNWANFILATNSHNPVPVPREDRRLNIAERQQTPLLQVLTDDDINNGFTDDVLTEFGAFLFQYPADPGRADKIKISQTRESLMRLGMTTSDNVVNAIKGGDTTFFLDERPSNAALPSRLGDTLLPPYDDFLHQIFNSQGSPMNVQREVLRSVFLHIANIKTETAHKFSNHINKVGLNVERFYIGPKPSDARRGIKGVVWQITDEDQARWAAIQAEEAAAKGKKNLSIVPSTT